MKLTQEQKEKLVYSFNNKEQFGRASRQTAYVNIEMRGRYLLNENSKIKFTVGHSSGKITTAADLKYFISRLKVAYQLADKLNKN